LVNAVSCANRDATAAAACFNCFFWILRFAVRTLQQFSPRLLLCGGGGAVAVVTWRTFMISLKACSNQVQDLPWSEMPESVACAAQSWARIAFCTPQEETSEGRVIPRV
jgi:hypothetical protein